MAYADAAAAKARLNELIAAADFVPNRSPVLDEARTNFLAGGAILAEQAQDWLWAYYRSVYEMYEPEQRQEYGIPEISNEATIWGHVDFRVPRRSRHPRVRPTSRIRRTSRSRARSTGSLSMGFSWSSAMARPYARSGLMTGTIRSHTRWRIRH